MFEYYEFPKQIISATDALEKVLTYSVHLRASDIHIDPKVGALTVRLRIDGELREVGSIDKHFHEELISRIKILCGARTDMHAVPQDGRWRQDIGGSDFNVRASFMPTYHGENAVLRLLPVRSEQINSFTNLGFSVEHSEMIKRALACAHGLILVTGPTGSGKTTTLHSALSQKAREPLSIITLEDPVEYEISGIRQVHVRHTYGVTFASGLRSALRQDPDVIMVGEIRDSETARVAIHTALTGHLVLSTLHTNSAIESIPRLIDMGVDAYLLASTLKLVIAQRLVRNVCPECSSEGCEQCRFSGYSGRSVIAEALEVDKGLKKLLASQADQNAISEYAKSQGMKNIREDGAEKVEWGITSIEEVLRVLNS